jgi:hypothetical protein
MRIQESSVLVPSEDIIAEEYNIQSNYQIKNKFMEFGRKSEIQILQHDTLKFVGGNEASSERH